VFDRLPFFGQQGVPFWVTVTVTILLIWLYTYKSGIKTIVWTDTLQTLFMLIALGAGIYYVADGLEISNISGLWDTVASSDLSQIFFFDDYKSGNYFYKQFFSGIFIAIVMTGLDQDMMQKNLTCRNLKDAQKNVFWFTLVLTVVNFVFLALGLLLTIYADKFGIDATKDKLFSTIAVDSGMGIGLAIFFLLGLIAAAYSSADSALTSLTTSFSIDILDIEKKQDEAGQIKTRKKVHIAMSLLLILVIVFFNYVIGDASVITKLFTFAGYTYGPLLGLYAFGLFSKWKVKDLLVPVVAIASPFLGFAISYFASSWFGFEFGFFILILNGLLTYLGLVLIRTQKN
jgi:Na+/proline symporter